MIFPEELLYWTASVVGFRTLPFVVYAMATARHALWKKVGWVLAYAALMSCLPEERLNILAFVGLGIGYYAAVSVAVFCISSKRAGWLMAPWLLFASCAVLFLILPAAFLPRAALPVLAFGFERMLAAYSYTKEARTEDRKLGACLFFLLVDPTVLYPDRGRVARPAIGLGFVRMLGGTVMIAASVTLAQVNRQVHPQAIAGPMVIQGAILLISLYWAHAGLANLQIGCMRLVGYEVGERYLQPLRAKDPADFWRRWNTYIGAWFRRYVFFPVSMWLARRRWRPDTAKVVALLVTFALVGVLHDICAVLSGSDPSLRMTGGFVAAGASVLVWVAGQRMWQRLPEHYRSEGRVRATMLGVLSRAYLWLFTLVAVWTAKT